MKQSGSSFLKVAKGLKEVCFSNKTFPTELIFSNNSFSKFVAAPFIAIDPDESFLVVPLLGRLLFGVGVFLSFVWL